MKNEMLQAPKIEFRDFLPINPCCIAYGGKRFKNQFKKNSKEQPLVSIVTIVLNGEKYLRDTINSVLNQSYLNLEYIIMDGGSTDGTLEIIREYEESIEIWYSEPDKGIAEAFNKGISLARGKLVGMINSDDWYEKNAVSTAVSTFIENNFDCFCGAMAWIKDEKVAYYINPHLKNIKKYMSFLHPSMFVKKEIYSDLGGFNPLFKIAMDYDFCVRIYKNNKKIFMSDRNLVNMRAIGISNKNRITALKENLLIKDEYFGSSFKNYLYYLKEVSIVRIVIFLRNFKLEPLVSLLRRIYFFFFQKNVQFKKESL